MHVSQPTPLGDEVDNSNNNIYSPHIPADTRYEGGVRSCWTSSGWA